MSGNIFQFPGGESPSPTVIPALAIEPCELVAELRHLSWSDRSRVFNNLIVDSLNALEARARHDGTDWYPQFREITADTLVAIHVLIAEVVTAMGDTIPTNDDAARLFTLSASREHRAMAQAYAGAPGDHTDARLRAIVDAGPESYKIFRRMSELERPGLTQCWLCWRSDKPAARKG